MQYNKLDVRMKENYENRYRFKLTRRIPVIVRIDGRAFHTFTHGFKKPYDLVLVNAMQDTAKYLCENIEGCQLAYGQSDEISLLLVDYKDIESNAFFDYNLNKIVSITASLATLEFNRRFKYHADKAVYNPVLYKLNDRDPSNVPGIICNHRDAIEKGACFDSRAFNIPKEEVTNYFYSRQIDASRNSIEMLGRAYFSHKQLNNKNRSNIQDMLFEKYGINWNNIETELKRGYCCIKKQYYLDNDGNYYKDTEDNIPDKCCLRSIWEIDHEIPQFKNEDREYIEKLVYVGE